VNANVKLFIMNRKSFYIKWVSCHHGMARPKVADGRRSLHIWRIAALYKQLRTADKGDPPAWGLGGELTTPHLKKNSMLRNVTKGLGLGWMLWNDLSHGKWTSDLELGMPGVSIGQVL
jgi:hypothetical protein